MKKILELKHWQVFFLLILGLFIGNLTIKQNPTVSSILTITGLFLYMIYPLSIGHFLQDYLPKNVNLNHNFFLFNFFIWLIAYSAIIIISDGKGMKFNGLIALPFLYLIYAFIHSLVFPAKTLKSIELGKKAAIGEYIGDFFLMAFLPIGVWFLQPRINKIINSKETRI